MVCIEERGEAAIRGWIHPDPFRTWQLSGAGQISTRPADFRRTSGAASFPFTSSHSLIDPHPHPVPSPCPFTHALIGPLRIHSLTHSLIHSFTHSLIHSFAYPLSLALAHSPDPTHIPFRLPTSPPCAHPRQSTTRPPRRPSTGLASRLWRPTHGSPTRGPQSLGNPEKDCPGAGSAPRPARNRRPAP